jgi:hypothetical protein
MLYLPLSLALLYVGKETGFVDVKLMHVMIKSGIWILRLWRLVLAQLTAIRSVCAPSQVYGTRDWGSRRRKLII